MNNRKLFLVWMLLAAALLLGGCASLREPAPDGPGIVSGKICYPTDHIPSLTLYFESLDGERVVSYRTHEGQDTYALELEPGRYTAYARLPEDILSGGMYSRAVLCGLTVDCTDHDLVPVLIESREETSGVDLCDWYAEPGAVPLPPGKIESMIAGVLREDHPDLDPGYLPVVEELTTMGGEIIIQISARIFRIVEEPFQDETFLITQNGIPLQLGTSEGGMGVSSLALGDTDGDGRAELYYTYSFGSGIHQSKIGVYAPTYDPQKTYPADIVYRGDWMLFSEEPDQIGVRAVEGDLETKTIRYQETLGELSLEKTGLEPELKLILAEDLPEEVLESLILPEDSSGSKTGDWVEYEDPHYGVRFAAPCFWEVRFPEQYHSSGTAYPIRNYSEEFVLSTGKKPVWEVGGIKIDLNFSTGEGWNLPEDAGLGDYLNAQYGSFSEAELLSADEVTVNGQPGLLVTAEGTFGINRYYLFKVRENLFMSFGAQPDTALEDPDVQGILGSLALSPEADVKIPDIVPADPPEDEKQTCGSRGAGTGLPGESPAQTGLRAEITSPETVPAGGPVWVRFTIANRGDRPLYLLDWYTPLEGVLGDIFQVTYRGQEQPYLGPLVSRAAPTPDQYVLLEPGDTETAVVDLAEVYDFSGAGNYQIVFRSPRISHRVEDPANFAESMDSLGPVSIPSDPITVTVDPSVSTDAEPPQMEADSPPPGESGELISLEGTVREVSLSARVIWLEEAVGGFRAVALREASTTALENRAAIPLQDIQPGMTIRAVGSRGERDALLASLVEVLE